MLRSSGDLMAGSSILASLAALALLAPLIFPTDSNTINPVLGRRPYGFENHLLGTDNLNRASAERSVGRASGKWEGSLTVSAPGGCPC